jgi:hypothetical protein
MNFIEYPFQLEPLASMRAHYYAHSSRGFSFSRGHSLGVAARLRKLSKVSSSTNNSTEVLLLPMAPGVLSQPYPPITPPVDEPEFSAPFSSDSIILESRPTILPVSPPPPPPPSLFAQELSPGQKNTRSKKKSVSLNRPLKSRDKKQIAHNSMKLLPALKISDLDDMLISEPMPPCVRPDVSAPPGLELLPDNVDTAQADIKNIDESVSLVELSKEYKESSPIEFIPKSLPPQEPEMIKHEASSLSSQVEIFCIDGKNQESRIDENILCVVEKELLLPMPQLEPKDEEDDIGNWKIKESSRKKAPKRNESAFKPLRRPKIYLDDYRYPQPLKPSDPVVIQNTPKATVSTAEESRDVGRSLQSTSPPKEPILDRVVMKEIHGKRRGSLDAGRHVFDYQKPYLDYFFPILSASESSASSLLTTGIPGIKEHNSMPDNVAWPLPSQPSFPKRSESHVASQFNHPQQGQFISYSPQYEPFPPNPYHYHQEPMSQHDPRHHIPYSYYPPLQLHYSQGSGTFLSPSSFYATPSSFGTPDSHSLSTSPLSSAAAAKHGIEYSTGVRKSQSVSHNPYGAIKDNIPTEPPQAPKLYSPFSSGLNINLDTFFSRQ